MVKHRKLGGVPAAAVLASMLFLAACSKSAGAGGGQAPSARPSSPAVLKILSPTNGEVVKGSDVKIEVSLTGARIVPATTTHITPDRGHLHVYLDNQLVGMNFATSDDVTGVVPGMHVLRVEFVASDHRPFDPRVFTAVTFQVKA
jgi:Family of unknown function (DUF6130)